MNYRLTHFCLFAGHFLLFFSLAFISGYDSYILLPFLPFLPFAGIKRLALEFLLRISHFRRWLDVQLWVSFKQKQIEKQADRQKNTGTRLWSSDRINLAHQMYHSVNWPFPVKSLLNDEERGRETRKKKRRREKNQKNGIELRGRKHFGWIIHYRGIKKLEWHLSNRERSENKTKKNKEKERDRGEGECKHSVPSYGSHTDLIRRSGHWVGSMFSQPNWSGEGKEEKCETRTLLKKRWATFWLDYLFDQES